MEIELEPWEVTGPGMLVRKNDETLLHFPDPIRATVTTKSYTIRLVARVDQDQLRPVVDELHVTRRPGGGPISADTLRSLGLKDVLREIAERTATRWVRSADGKRWEANLLEDGVEQQISTHEVALAFKPASGRAIPFSEIERAAAVYRQAVADKRRDATMAVAEALNLSRTTAARRIKKARQAGLLGAPLRTRAGEGRTP